MWPEGMQDSPDGEEKLQANYILISGVGPGRWLTGQLRRFDSVRFEGN
jgi:hypothetical protein